MNGSRDNSSNLCSRRARPACVKRPMRASLVLKAGVIEPRNLSPKRFRAENLLFLCIYRGKQFRVDSTCVCRVEWFLHVYVPFIAPLCPISLGIMIPFLSPSLRSLVPLGFELVIGIVRLHQTPVSESRGVRNHPCLGPGVLSTMLPW
eukprot:5477831-Prymnesium_polylepis.1